MLSVVVVLLMGRVVSGFLRIKFMRLLVGGLYVLLVMRGVWSWLTVGVVLIVALGL